MATRISKPVRRIVSTLHHGDLVVTLAEEGVYYREPRRRTAFLLPHGVAFQRAVDIHLQRERAEKKVARLTRRVR